MTLRTIDNIEKEEMTKVEFSTIEKTTNEISILKYKIIFNTINGLLSTKTTIWFVGSKYILLKGNIYIPINAIKDVI